MVGVREVVRGVVVGLVVGLVVLAEEGTTDYYASLGLPSSCTQREIRKKFRALALKFHPDKNKEAGAEQKFRQMAAAYQVLSDPEKRAKYDKYGHAAFSHSPPAGAHHFNFDMNDLFSHFDFGDEFAEGAGLKREKGTKEGPNSFFSFDHLFDHEEESFFEPHGFGGGESFFGSHFGGDGEEGAFAHSHAAHHTFSHSSHSSHSCSTRTEKVGNVVRTYTHCS